MSVSNKYVLMIWLSLSSRGIYHMDIWVSSYVFEHTHTHKIFFSAQTTHICVANAGDALYVSISRIKNLRFSFRFYCEDCSSMQGILERSKTVVFSERAIQSIWICDGIITIHANSHSFMVPIRFGVPNTFTLQPGIQQRLADFNDSCRQERDW